MKKNLLVMGALAAIAFSNTASAQTWSEDFNSGIPGTWTLHNVDGLTPNSNLSINFGTAAWVAATRATGDQAAVSTSWYSSPGTANDWLVSPAFTVSPNMILKWEEFTPDANYPDGYEVRLSTTGTAVADFATVLYSTTAANTSNFTIKHTDLSVYSGQSVHIAFRNNSNDKYLLYIDNVTAYVPPANELEITSVTPVGGSPLAYDVSGNNIALGGSVFNNGILAVTSFTVKYQQGTNPVVSTPVTGVNIAPFASYNFSATPYVLPATVGEYPITMWIELTGDVDNTNDTSNTLVGSAAFKPTKKIFIEEGTGTWCGWCPRGHVYMDSIWGEHPENFSLVAVHNNDPMVVSAYDAFLGTKIGGYPSMLVDRRNELDPSDLFDVYNEQKDYFGFADITLTNVPAAGFGFAVKATVKPAINLSGDYRLALVLTEDDVHGTGADWAQTNYYSSTQANQPLVGAGFDWQAEPAEVPADQMFYDFVGRAIFPGVNGATGSLPATMTANTPYDYTFTTSINPGFHRNKMRAIAILIRNSDGEVLNSNNMTVPLGISDVAAGVDYLRIFPNPTSDNSTIKFTLNENTKVSVQVIDAVGRVVNVIPEQSFNKGTNQISLNTASLPNGLYNVKINTEKGSMTERLSVIK